MAVISQHIGSADWRIQRINPFTPNDPYRDRTAPLTSKVAFYIFIEQILVRNILNMVYTFRFFPLQNAVCFIILTCLVPVLFTFCVQGVLKLKKFRPLKVNPLTPNDHYRGRTAPLTSKVAFYIFIQQI